MSSRIRTVAIWGPRLLGLAMAGFMALFALDAFGIGSLSQQIRDFVLHLVPAAIVAAVVAIAWRYPWAGAIGFVGLAVAYAAMSSDRPDWILVISGPLALLAVLFAISASIGRNPPREVKQVAGHSA